jgi:hypothetical protein
MFISVEKEQDSLEEIFINNFIHKLKMINNKQSSNQRLTNKSILKQI